jgi:phosphate acyltransferase
MIALDVMGGDYAPEQIIIGALRAAKKSNQLILVGPEDIIRANLDKQDPAWQNYPITICHAPSIIGMAEEPVFAVRQKKDSSIVKIIELVKTGRADAAISAGNSGAVMVAASFILGRVDGLERPAIAGLLPTVDGGKFLTLDLGANTDCRPQHLVQFAYFAAGYAKNVLGIQNPRIALLCNGEEDSKGSLVTKEAFKLLKDSKLNFVGNMEPHDIFHHKTDVVICDGFAGNIFLKTIEGSFDLLTKLVARGIGHEKGVDAKFCNYVAKTAKNSLISGGAALFGVKGNVFICHGNAHADVIEIAIENCVKYFSVK